MIWYKNNNSDIVVSTRIRLARNVDKTPFPNALKDTKEVTEKNVECMSKFRIIPYNSIGRQNGLMLGFKADKVKIIIDDEEKEVNNAIIGIFNESFNSNTYSALISLEIL